jgi:hypothetical protein
MKISHRTARGVSRGCESGLLEIARHARENSLGRKNNFNWHTKFVADEN